MVAPRRPASARLISRSRRSCPSPLAITDTSIGQLARRLRVGGARHDDDRNVGQAFFLAQLLDEAPAVDARHQQIDGDHVGPRGAGDLQRRRRIARVEHDVAGVRQLLPHQPAEIIVIVDDQHAADDEAGRAVLVGDDRRHRRRLLRRSRSAA